MINTKFEIYKLQRELKRNGISCVFKRYTKNEFGEPDHVHDNIVCEIKCLYHEQNSNIQITTGETTQVRTKKIPMLLCLYENTSLLKPGDFVILNEKKYKVTGIVNIQEWNLICDISLEVVDNVIQDRLSF